MPGLLLGPGSAQAHVPPSRGGSERSPARTAPSPGAAGEHNGPISEQGPVRNAVLPGGPGPARKAPGSVDVETELQHPTFLSTWACCARWRAGPQQPRSPRPLPSPGESEGDLRESGRPGNRCDLTGTAGSASQPTPASKTVGPEFKGSFPGSPRPSHS